MSSKLRQLLGTRHRHHLALEDFDPTAVNPPGVENSNEDTTVVMKGPLADVYSDALAKTFDKENPVEDPNAATPPAGEEGKIDGQETPPENEEPKVDTTNLVPAEGQTQETVEAAIVSQVGNIVLESQAIDATVASAVAASLAEQEPADGSAYETLYAIDETQITPQDVTDVTSILSQADKPENVTVLIDDVVPDAMIDETAPTVTAAKEMAVALESMVVAMGGNVVHSFPDYVKQRAARRK